MRQSERRGPRGGASRSSCRRSARRAALARTFAPALRGEAPRRHAGPEGARQDAGRAPRQRLLPLCRSGRWRSTTRPQACSPRARARLAGIVPQARRGLPTGRRRASRSVVRAHAEAIGAKLGQVAQPLRAALTGRATSPGLFDVMAVLGRDETLARLARPVCLNWPSCVGLCCMPFGCACPLRTDKLPTPQTITADRRRRWSSEPSLRAAYLQSEGCPRFRPASLFERARTHERDLPHAHRRQQAGRARGEARHHRPERRRHLQALRPDRDVHLRSRLHLDRELRVRDHLHRRRRGRAALSRLPDRAARRARRLPRDLLSPALRRAADRRPEGGFRLPRHAPHHGARADDAVLPGLPPRRAPDGDHGRLRRRALGLLPRLDRHLGSAPAHGRLHAHDRQDADARRDGLQVLDRPAVRVSAERPRLHLELPAHVLRGAVRGVQGQPGAVAGARPHLHPARRPRAERLDLDGAARRLVRRQPLRLHRGRRSPACGGRPMAAPTRRR